MQLYKSNMCESQSKREHLRQVEHHTKAFLVDVATARKTDEKEHSLQSKHNAVPQEKQQNVPT